METSTMGMLLSKLKDPHPTVQRYAVRSIFEELKIQIGKKSAHEYSQTLLECMLQASRSVPALDEALSQLCVLVLDDHDGALSRLILTHLQATLESAPAQAVPSVVRSIGFICRRFLSTHSHTVINFQTYELHPFVKAFRSRRESHPEIVQQVLALLTHNGSIKNFDILGFLQPFFNYVLLQPLVHISNLVAARDLYFGLASLISLNFLVGSSLTKVLLHYVYHLTSHSTEEADWKFVASRELVDAFENLMMQATGEAEVEECKPIAADIQALLMDTCYELTKQGLSFRPFLELLGRIVKVQKSLELTLLWRIKILNLAHLLSLTMITEEQILLIGLARKVLRKKNREGVDVLIDSSHAFPFALLWVYPVVNVTATSCTNLKEAAGGFLKDVEDLLALHWSQETDASNSQSLSVCMVSPYGTMADNMHTVLFMLWFDIGFWRTWKSIEAIADWFRYRKNDIEAWIIRLTRYVKENSQNCLKTSDPSTIRPSENSDLISWVCMLISVLLIHPHCNSAATKAIAELGKNDPVLGFSLVPVVLFYLRAWKRHWKGADSKHLFRLLQLLPTLGLHPLSSSIIAGMLQSLLRSDGVLPGTAVRLLCRSWETADKVYPHLQVQLNLSHFVEPTTNFETVLGRAASLRDVCRLDADRGVELILSVQACIQSESFIVKALGLESLAWLCQHDVIDFYTAWEVLAAWFSDLPSNTMLAKSLCFFLQYGALDAAAYPDLSCTILQLLWKAAMPSESQQSDQDCWMVQEKALRALTSFEVDDLIRCSGEFTGSHVQILLSQRRIEVLKACEGLVVKLLFHEFKSRPRGQENVKHTDNKVRKIINAIPQVLSASVQRETSLLHSPAVFILLRCHRLQFSESSRRSNTKSTSKGWENEFEHQFTEMADSTDLHGNLICALLHLDMWYSFLIEQLKEENTSAAFINVAPQVVKVLCKVSSEAIPRVAENAILALAVLYQITTSKTSLAATFDSSHDSIVSYLKSCLAQNCHEYLQWTSAAALGYVARYCSNSDWILKVEVSTTLLECLSRSDRDIVRGACSMGLGLLFHNIFTQDMVDSEVHKEPMVQQKDLSIHSCMFQHLVKLLLTWCPEMKELLENISRHNAMSINSSSEILLPLPSIKPLNKSEEGIWTVAGLAMALGSSVIAFEKIGSLESMSHVTKFLIEGIRRSHTNPGSKDCFYALALGAYVTLPSCIGACLHLELLTKELDSLIPDAIDFLNAEKNSNRHPTELKMAACVGSGNLLATLLNHGIHKVPRDSIFSLIESLKAIAIDGDAELASLGGCIGLANALGAGVALLVPERGYRIDELKSMPQMNGGMESSNICTPLLYESSCKTYVQNLLQDLLNYAVQGSAHIRTNAWWALALVRRIFMEGGNPEGRATGSRDVKSSKISLTGLAKDSSLFLLCSWLLNVKENPVESLFPCHTVASVLRCLKQVPQLPNLDWGTLLRQILHALGSSKKCGITEGQNIAMQDAMCRECVLFSLAHAHNLSVLQAFLDELCDFPRLISIRTSMTSVLMLHMRNLSSIFSRSRMEMFFFDCVEVACRASDSWCSESLFSADACWDLRISFWKGFKSLLLHSKDGAIPSIDKNKLLLGAEKCYCLLNIPLKETESELHKIEEWSEALDCLALASDEWIVRVTEFDVERSVPTTQAMASARKAIFVKSQMVARHCLQPSALVKPVMWLHNQAALDAFQELVWVACALKDITMEEKQSWLMDTLETVFSLKNPETGVVFLALLVSSWCYYSPLILIDSRTTMQALPFTLSSLLSQENWRPTSKLVLQRCVSLLTSVADPSLTARGLPLWYVKRACTILRKDLPVMDQLKLVDDLSMLTIL
ncbi:hypothetical protein GOP47_0021495 [Adiantum capillus-veneris]|uniref:DUF3730 domain-containing protein n=1 Tax=Adiantum capillus-veneris TaxID=13818 RepID=A0A9D4Z5A1_ADICA|nr:hypothetical protein GOP47_0021495 [Adiantum capillus-veneris]